MIFDDYYGCFVDGARTLLQVESSGKRLPFCWSDSLMELGQAQLLENQACRDPCIPSRSAQRKQARTWFSKGWAASTIGIDLPAHPRIAVTWVLQLWCVSQSDTGMQLGGSVYFENWKTMLPLDHYLSAWFFSCLLMPAPLADIH